MTKSSSHLPPANFFNVLLDVIDEEFVAILYFPISLRVPWHGHVKSDVPFLAELLWFATYKLLSIVTNDF